MDGQCNFITHHEGEGNCQLRTSSRFQKDKFSKWWYSLSKPRATAHQHGDNLPLEQFLTKRFHSSSASSPSPSSNNRPRVPCYPVPCQLYANHNHRNQREINESSSSTSTDDDERVDLEQKLDKIQHLPYARKNNKSKASWRKRRQTSYKTKVVSTDNKTQTRSILVPASSPSRQQRREEVHISEEIMTVLKSTDY